MVNPSDSCQEKGCKNFHRTLAIKSFIHFILQYSNHFSMWAQESCVRKIHSTLVSSVQDSWIACEWMQWRRRIGLVIDSAKNKQNNPNTLDRVYVKTVWTLDLVFLFILFLNLVQSEIKQTLIDRSTGWIFWWVLSKETFDYLGLDRR